MPNLIALAIPLFFIAIGVELVVARRRRRPVYRLGSAMADMGCGVAQQLVGVLVGAFSLGIYAWVYSHRVLTLPDKSLWSWLAAIIGVEFFYYWWHRGSHEVNLLWAAHVVHHHSEDYNLAVALRQSVTTWATMLPFYLPLAILGVPTFEYAVVLSPSTLYQFWIHTELVPPLGFLERWLNTPSLHRVHHAINPRYLDKNHSATFIVFDRLFGTYQREEHEEACTYGITRPLGSYNILWAQVAGYVDLVRMARRAPNWRQALKVFVASPAWHPEWLERQPPGPPPSIGKYEPSPTARAKWHALGQFALLIIGVFSFLMWGGQLSGLATAVCFALFTMTLITVPALIESKQWAWKAEGARLLLMVPAIALLVTGAL